MKIQLKKNEFILCGIIAFLILIILTGTVIALSQNSTTKNQNSNENTQSISPIVKRPGGKNASYAELGQIRAVTKTIISDGQEISGTPLVVTPILSYPEGDTVFYEELSGKRHLIKDIFRVYFTTHTQSELLSKTEDSIKMELLTEINDLLTLGKISGIYFSDYIFLQ